jgi:hypothetical protein
MVALEMGIATLIEYRQHRYCKKHSSKNFQGMGSKNQSHPSFCVRVTSQSGCHFTLSHWKLPIIHMAFSECYQGPLDFGEG